jgi:hypothetical protein
MDPDDVPAGADPAWDMDQLKELLEAEKAVPKGFNCNATTQGKSDTSEKSWSAYVDNEINYGDFGSNNYVLGLTPAVPVVLADLINTDAKTDKEMLASFKGLPGVGDIQGIGVARAKDIYAAFKQKGRITNGKADLGIGLLALNNLNKAKNLRITSGVKAWPSATAPAAP